MTTSDDTQDRFAPACGSGGFLAQAALYYTPSRIIALAKGQPVDDYHHLLSNPLYGFDADGKSPN